MRLLIEEDARLAEEEEARSAPVKETLRNMVIEGATPTAEEEASQIAADARASAATLRAQSMRASVTWAVKFSWGAKTFEGEFGRLAEEAAERLEAAVDGGDVEAAATAREDEIAARSMQADAIDDRIRVISRDLEAHEMQAKDCARRAYSQRQKASAAMLAMDVADEQAQMRQALANWAKRQAADERVADGYRAAVEAAWRRTAGGEGVDDVSAMEAMDLWSRQLSRVDVSEMPELAQPTFATITDRVSYSTVQAIVAAAEREEEQAAAAAQKVETTRATLEATTAELEQLRATIVRRTANLQERRTRQEDGGDKLQAALEAAMLGGAVSVDGQPFKPTEDGDGDGVAGQSDMDGPAAEADVDGSIGEDTAEGGVDGAPGEGDGDGAASAGNAILLDQFQQSLEQLAEAETDEDVKR